MQKISSSYIVVTGAAGFIGSNILRKLNNSGIENIIIVDHMTKEKKKNLTGLQFYKYYEKDIFLKKVLSNSLPSVSAIIHMGACSDTKEYDSDYLKKNNYEYSKELFRFAQKNKCQFIYASSASVYGNGSKGYKEKLIGLKPLNPYGHYKYLFDTWVLRQKKSPKQWVGLRFFNVYGPNEYHKKSMASVIYHGYNQIKKSGKMHLFKSYNKDYGDGMQLRDFVYVADVVDVILFFLKNSQKSGIFNVGTGKARSFLDLANATFHSMKLHPDISFIDMPEALQKKYQYFTQADLHALHSVGYTKEFTSLEKGVRDYVAHYLMPHSL